MSVKRINIDLSDKRFDQIAEGIRKSYANSCILWIEEIENTELEKLYQEQKKEIENKRGKACQELLLYHGTCERAAELIIRDGFNPELNHRAVFGKGTYFAKDAIYCRSFSPPAKDNISFMLICSVLVGEIGRYGNMVSVNTAVHDNAVDSLTKPTIYVTPYPYGAIPRYLLAFHRDAR